MCETRKIRRPVMRYHGGKWRLAPWVIKHLPEHNIYVEPFGGAGSVLIRKPRSRVEVYNDLDGEVCNVFRVLRDLRQSAELQRRLCLTPYSRDEFILSYEPAGDPVEQARRTLVRSGMAFGSSGVGARRRCDTAFRAKSGDTRNLAHEWVGFTDEIAAFTERLSGVCIENRDALEIIAQQDSLTTLFYVDPPYLASTRTARRNGRNCYRHEIDDDGHDALLEALKQVAGMVVLSCYPHSSYTDHLSQAGWQYVECDALADGAKRRTEGLWISPLAWEKLKNRR